MRAPAARTWALTATCAANALGLVEGEEHWSHGSREAAMLAFEALGGRLRRDAATSVARAMLDGAVDKIADGGRRGGEARTTSAPTCRSSRSAAPARRWRPRSRERLGRPLLRPTHPEVLSSIGAALSLVRAEVVRHASSPDGTAELVARGRARLRRCRRRAADGHRRRRASSRATTCCARSRPAPSRSSPAPPSRERLDEEGQRAAAARGHRRERPGGAAPRRRDRLLPAVQRRRLSSHVAVVDEIGAVPVCARARQVVSGAGGARPARRS